MNVQAGVDGASPGTPDRAHPQQSQGSASSDSDSFSSGPEASQGDSGATAVASQQADKVDSKGGLLHQLPSMCEHQDWALSA